MKTVKSFPSLSSGRMGVRLPSTACWIYAVLPAVSRADAASAIYVEYGIEKYCFFWMITNGSLSLPLNKKARLYSRAFLSIPYIFSAPLCKHRQCCWHCLRLYPLLRHPFIALRRRGILYLGVYALHIPNDMCKYMLGLCNLPFALSFSSPAHPAPAPAPASVH